MPGIHQRAASALRDPLDGGFHRATADAQATIPVFQKRLIDQARIALAYVDAATRDNRYLAGAHNAPDLERVRGVRRSRTGPPRWEPLPPATSTPAKNWRASRRTQHPARRSLRRPPPPADLLPARDQRGDLRIRTIATAAAHGLLRHALKETDASSDERDYIEAIGTLKQALSERVHAGTDNVTLVAKSTVPATPEDHFLVGLGLDNVAPVNAGDDALFETEFALYYAVADDVLGVRPFWWEPAAGNLPPPAVWRLLLPAPAPDGLAAEVAAPFENPDTPPDGAVLLALHPTTRE